MESTLQPRRWLPRERVLVVTPSPDLYRKVCLSMPLERRIHAHHHMGSFAKETVARYAPDVLLIDFRTEEANESVEAFAKTNLRSGERRIPIVLIGDFRSGTQLAYLRRLGIDRTVSVTCPERSVRIAIEDLLNRWNLEQFNGPEDPAWGFST